MINVDALVKEAMRWPGTPWCANSCACGVDGGVSCHELPRALFVNSKHLSDLFPHVQGDPSQSRHSFDSAIEKWMDARHEFFRPESQLPTSALPGDVFGIRIYNCIDHMGTVLPDGKFIHVLQKKNTAIDQITAWLPRVLAIWRLV